MKTGYKLIMTLAAIMILLPAQAQIFGNDPKIEIEGLSGDNAWQVIEMALLDNGFAPGEFNPGEGHLFSDWIQWTSIAISNRTRLYFTYAGGKTVLSIVDRGYKSDEGWSEAVGNLSKKNYKKFAQSVADRIQEIRDDDALVIKAIKDSKLIPAFKAVNMMGNVEWKLMSAQQTENERPELLFEVTNKGSKPVKLTSFGGEFEKMAGIGTARFGVKWEKSLEDNYKQTILKPGETIKAMVSVGAGYRLKTAIGYVMRIGMQYDDGNTEKMDVKVYNVPLPYTYKEGD